MKRQHLRNILLFLLSICMLSAAFSTLVAYAAAGDVSVQNGTGTSAAIEISQSYSYRAIVNGAIDRFGISMSTTQATGTACTLSLYAWAGTYESTLAGEPIASQTFTELQNSTYIWLDFPAQPAGEYLFHVSDVTGQVGVWTKKNPKNSKGFLYIDGKEQKGDPALKVHFENAKIPTEAFGTCQASADAQIPQAPYKSATGKATATMTVSAGIRLNVTAPINGVNFNLATYHATDLRADVSIYAWKGTYAATVEADPVVSQRILLIDNCMQGIVFDKLPAGDYLFLVHNASSTPALYTYSEVTGFEGYVYKDGFMVTSSVTYPDMQVVFAGEAENGAYFAKCEQPADAIDGNHTPPPESTIPADSLIYTHPVQPDTWVFTDGLGRTSLTYADVGAPRDNKTLAMFFWTWHTGSFIANEPTNLQKIYDAYPETMRDYNHAVWQNTSTYWWNESIYGFYSSEDTWVLRKQVELLANAGVDVILTDNTNGDLTWQTAYNKLFEVWEDALQDGLNTPKVSFMLPFVDKTYTNMQVSSIYQDLYRTGRYQNHWYYFEGKPMLMARYDAFDPSNSLLEKEISGFFTFRAGTPMFDTVNPGYKTWGWLSVFPQIKHYASAKDEANGVVEQITVGTAVNYSYTQKLMAAMSGDNVTGRSYTSAYPDRYFKEGAEATKWGYNFAEQWNYALEADPQVVFVTGWNEFRVDRNKVWPEGWETETPNAFPDQYIDEFSRDIEPTKGALKDHYYYQLVNFVRQYKGCNPIPTPSEKTTIDLAAGQEQWKSVEPYFGAYIGNTENRDHTGYGSLVYTETSGRNDIIGAQVARDDEYVYFNVECADNITPYTDNLWMTLYIDSDQQNQGWETFEYVINKSAASADTVVLEKFTGNGYESTKVADCAYVLDGRYLTIKVAKADLGLAGDDYTINFSWTDNVHDEGDYDKFSGDIMDFYISGDVAPGARFKYSYVSGTPAAEDTTAGETTAPTETEPADTTDTDSVGSNSSTESNFESTESTESTEKTGCKAMAAAAVALTTAAAAAIMIKKKKD